MVVRATVLVGWLLGLALLTGGAPASAQTNDRGGDSPTARRSPARHRPSKRRARKRRPRKRSVAFLDPAAETSPSYRYAALTGAACRAELRRRGVPYLKVPEARGVRAPVRVPDGVGGVVYRTAQSREKRLKSAWDVFDCRLVLALHDLSAILSRHRIDEVLIYSSWRPPREGWPAGKEAIRHPGGLAVDIFQLRRVVGATARPPGDAPDGSSRGPAHEWLDVERDFAGRIDDATCGPRATPPRSPTEKARALRAMVCEAAKARIFTSILTPNHDKAHFNHFHFDLHLDVKWRIVR